jgi:hypothetical protein
LRNKSGRGVNDPVVTIGNSQHGGQRGFGEGKLLPDKFACVDAAYVINCEDGKRATDDADRNAVNDLDDNVSHTHALSREVGQAMAGRIAQHPVKSRVRQAAEGAVIRDEESAADSNLIRSVAQSTIFFARYNSRLSRLGLK